MHKSALLTFFLFLGTVCISAQDLGSSRTNRRGIENLEIWGRRIWIPAARPEAKDGFVIRMLATSLSDILETLEDVGQKGELGKILKTFEPNRDYDN